MDEEWQILAMNRFDMHAFHALDTRRQIRGLSWAQRATDINRPFESTPSIPINPTTLRDMLKKRSVTSAVVPRVFRWLGRTPKSFLADRVSPNEQPDRHSIVGDCVCPSVGA